MNIYITTLVYTRSVLMSTVRISSLNIAKRIPAVPDEPIWCPPGTYTDRHADGHRPGW